jgi:hypothetical protein
MRIEGNSIGNYSINYLNNISKNIEASKNLQPKKELEANISSEEKNFFAQLYPQNTKEINEYSFYSRDAKAVTTYLGSIIDRRA